MPQQDPSRTEKPTGKRIKKAREKGNVAKSQEVGKAVVLLAGLLAMQFWIEYIGKEMLGLYRRFLAVDATFTLTAQSAHTLVLESMASFGLMVGPVLVFIGAASYLSMKKQVGDLWVMPWANFDAGKFFNVFAGLKKLLIDPRTLLRLGKSLLQALAIALAAWFVLDDEKDKVLPLYHYDAQTLAAYILETGARMVWYVLVPTLAVAAGDLWYSRWDYEEQLKMTKDEVKDEQKQAEGDPVIRSKQKEKMMKFMAQRMFKDVPKADVVITNPTHFAVALKYDPLMAPAPVVLAKGVDRIALKIKDIARENRVPIRENKPLAQALYKTVEIGEAIPEELYKAVAAVLAQVMAAKKQRPHL